MVLFKGIEFQHLSNALFFIIPFLVIVVMLLGVRKKEAIMAYLKLKFRKRFAIVTLIITSLGFVLCVIALLGPVQEAGEKKMKREGLDIYVLLDTSKSMLVEDIAPSRIERSKKIVEDLLGQLQGDRIGFIPFASSAYIQMPLTDDYDLAKLFLGALDTDMMSGSGTDIGKAIILASQSFVQSGDGDRVILILSDGEEHNQETDKIISKLSNDRLKIFTIGVGTLDGGMIPIYSEDGKTRTGYKKDERGQLIISKLDEASLQALSSQSGGTYARISIGNDVSEAFFNSLANLKKDTLKTKTITQYEQSFQWFLGLGIVLLLLGAYTQERSRK